MAAARRDRWRRTIWVALAIMLMAGILGAPSAQADTLTFRYVANTGMYSSFYNATQRSTPAGHTAPGGWFWFTSTGSSFTLRFDDPTLVDGQTVPVYLDQRRPDGTRRAGWTCVPVRSTARFPSVSGATVNVNVANEVHWWALYDRPCGVTGSHAGTAYVGR